MMTVPDPDRADERRVFLSLLTALRHLNFPGSAETIFTDAMATGFMGGDSGHGGNAAVTFTQNGGAMDAIVKRDDGREVHLDGVQQVTVTVGGDWEQGDLLRGLIQAAVILARALYAQPRC
jgi:hypothetical protein